MPIRDMQASDINEFWEMISPFGSVLGSMGSPLCRGQLLKSGDEEWKLTPKIFREDVIDYAKRGRSDFSYVDHLVFHEYFHLLDFLSSCDDSGLQIPFDCTAFRSLMNFDEFASRYSVDTEGWPHPDAYHFLALAQHHGVPTRLLDWSYSPYVASYFAASQALDRYARNSLNDACKEDVVVWVVDTKQFWKEKNIEIVKVPGSVSSNLAAQRGVFLLGSDGRAKTRNEMVESISLDEIFEESMVDLYKLILPARFVGDLFERCLRMGFSAAMLFPGFDGAAKAAVEFQIYKRYAGRL